MVTVLLLQLLEGRGKGQAYVMQVRARLRYETKPCSITFNNELELSKTINQKACLQEGGQVFDKKKS